MSDTVDSKVSERLNTMLKWLKTYAPDDDKERLSQYEMFEDIPGDERLNWVVWYSHLKYDKGLGE